MALDPMPLDAMAGTVRQLVQALPRSTFFTGWPAAVRQPFFFQPWIHSW